MADKVWQKIPNRRSLLWDINGSTKNSGWLDFSKWFTYKNQDLSNVHNSADEINSLNRKKMEKYLWIEISKDEPSDEYIMNYAKSLTWDRSKIANNLAEQWYDFNESVAYLDNYERLWFVNPMGKWLELFKKDNSQWASFERIERNVWKTLLWAESLWFLWNEIWDAWFRKMTPPTDMDVQRSVTDDRTLGKYNSAKEQYDKVTEKLKWMSEWDEWYSELKKSQEYRKSEMNRLDKDMRPTTVDILEEEKLSWSDYDLAVDADVRAYEKRTQELEDVFNKSTKKYKKSDFIDKLTRESFPNVSDEAWVKYYEPKIEEMKKIYSNADEIDLRWLEQWKKQYKPSWESLVWDYATNAEKAINDKMFYNLWEGVRDWLEETQKWAWFTYKKYWLLEERAGNQLDKLKSILPQDKTKTNKKSSWKWFKRDFATWLRDKSNYVRPSYRFNKVENTLVGKLGLPVETAKSITKWVEKWENFISKIWKFWWRYLAAVMPLLDTLAVIDELNATEKRYELLPSYTQLQQKKLWKLWFDKWTYYEWWTEKDWENAWLWQDVIRDYLDSDEYQQFLEATTYKWTWARQRALESDSIMYY